MCFFFFSSNSLSLVSVNTFYLRQSLLFSSLCIFLGHWLDFSACERQDRLSTFQKSEKATYLDNLVFSAVSVL